MLKRNNKAVFFANFLSLLCTTIPFQVNGEEWSSPTPTTEYPELESTPSYGTTPFDYTTESPCNSDSCPVEMYCDFRFSECRCKDALYTKLHSKMNRCLLIPGGACIGDPSDSNYVPCITGAYCDDETKHCKCSAGTKLSAEGYCQANYGETCEYYGEDEVIRGPFCNREKFLVCDETKATCTCQGSEKYMVWDTISERCVSMIGKPCGFNLDDEKNYVVECVSGSKCVADQDGTSKTCELSLEI